MRREKRHAGMDRLHVLPAPMEVGIVDSLSGRRDGTHAGGLHGGETIACRQAGSALSSSCQRRRLG